MIGTHLLYVKRILQILPPRELLYRPAAGPGHPVVASGLIRFDKNHRITKLIQPGLIQLRRIEHNRPYLRVCKVPRHKFLAGSAKSGVDQILQSGQFAPVAKNDRRNRLAVNAPIRRENGSAPPPPHRRDDFRGLEFRVGEPIEINNG